MTTFLLVRDGGDYGAMTFSEHYDEQKVYEEMIAEGVTEKDVPHPEYEDEVINVEIVRFGEVDPEFISFMYNEFIDYDATKAVDIFEVKEPRQ